MLVLGVLAIIMPLAATLTMSVFIGWFLIVGGVIGMVQSFVTRTSGSLWGRLAISALMAIAGVLIVTNVLASTLTLTVLLGWWFIITGAFQLVVAITDRSAMPGWGWLAVSGGISLLLGILILNSLPSSAAWAIGLLVGVHLIFSGWWSIWGALELHRAQQAS